MKPPDVRSQSVSPRVPRSASEVRQWLISQLAEVLQIKPETIDADRPILASGIDSMQVIGIVASLEDWLKIRFPENPLDEHATIEALSQYVANLSTESH